jgi:crotonobetainyl-CoA:carnitine CoA-transferase CaiB-like acyl-CoA transferase
MGGVFGDRVPCAAVRPIEDMFDHPQVLAEDLVTTLDHPLVDRHRTMTKPIKFSDTPGPVPTTDFRPAQRQCPRGARLFGR